MTSWYVFIKWVHILSSTVLFGTGAGIAFFFMRAHRTGEARIIAVVSSDVVLADFIFTATAVVLQPITGVALALIAGFPLSTGWLCWSVALYILIGCCWLPVVWLQIQMRKMAVRAAADGTSLPQAYRRYFAWWFGLGWPAFLGVMAVFYLMVAKPSF